MKMRELMERCGLQETGRAAAYVKEGLREMNMITETHINNERFTITQNQRYYNFPRELVKLTGVKVKNHMNSKDEYRQVPRLVYEPNITDSDEDTNQGIIGL